MKSILVIISRGPLGGQYVIEMLSAIMVLATFGHQVKVCLIHDGRLLLQAPCSAPVDRAAAETFQSAGFFKSAHTMLQSFEFYDLLPIWVVDDPAATPSLDTPPSPIALEYVSLNPARLNSFDQVLYW